MSSTKTDMYNLRKIIASSLVFLVLSLFIFIQPTSAQVNIINNSTTVAGSAVSTQRHIVKTSEGTLHSFIQTGTQAATCGGTSQVGLLWFTSTDGGTTWVCGGQLSSNTSNLFYASATVDVNDNIYVVYSVATGAGGAPYNVYYRMLTKDTGSVWTFGNEQTVLTPPIYSGYTGGYSYATVEVEGTTRLWMAVQYFDGTNFMIKVLYSNGLSTAPTWTQSTGALDYPANSGGYHVPLFVRFGSKIGIIYNDQATGVLRWKFRNDADGLTSWSAETTVSNGIATYGYPVFSAVGDSNGNIYLANGYYGSVIYTYWNGSVWSPQATISGTSAQYGSAYVSVTTDGTNAWVFYPDTLGLAAGSKMVYKKGYYPFTASEFDILPTPVASYHTTFDKSWRYFSGAYTDVSTVAGNSTASDVSMVTAVGDMMYFGKSAQFDSVSWIMGTNGVGGVSTWEYWNGSAWTGLSFTISSNVNFQGSGYGAFVTPSDWVATPVNGESYYYIRSRVSTLYSTSPIGTQMYAFPQATWGSVAPYVSNNTAYALWTENASSPMRVRETGVTVTTSTVNSSTPVPLSNSVAYSATTLATQVSTQRHIVKTTDGTLHSFIQSTTTLPCSGSSSANNTVGLNWLTSPDGGTTWNCAGQLSSDTVNLMYASATVDSGDNIYVVYSVAANGGSAAYNVYYRMLTKGSGSTWTLGTEQKVLTAPIPYLGFTPGYSYATVEVQGTTRLWLATRYWDGINYMIKVLSSDSLSTAPTWTESTGALDIPTTGAYHIPVLVRFKDNIGVIYGEQTTNTVRWRFHNDADPLTFWNNETYVSNGITSPTTANFSAVGDTAGNIYLAVNNATVNIIFTYWNGEVWTPQAIVSGTGVANASVSVATDGTNAWVFYRDSLSLAAGSKMVYKKGYYPFTASEFDILPTPVASYHTTFDKSWRYYSGGYTDLTTAAANSTVSDVPMVTAVGDMMYFGKNAKFDSVAYTLPTGGTVGQIAWEYYNGSIWTLLTKFTAVSAPNLTASGYITFIPNGDWATTPVNGESYYYVRARVTNPYTISPIGSQMVAFPQTYWASVAPYVSNNTIYTLWGENASVPIRVKETGIAVSTNAYNATSSAEINNLVGYSTTTASTHPSTSRHIVKTSDGTLHAFIHSGTGLACGNSTDVNNTFGLMWVTSTDDGVTWTCQKQLSGNIAVYFYASVVADSSDNIYVVYSTANNGRNSQFQVFYQKLTKGSGSNWAVGAQQTVLDVSSSIGYSYASIELQDSTRLWMAVRYFDGTNYQIPVYYTNDLSAAPTWTQSISTLDIPGGTTTNHYPTIVRYGSNIGVIYNDQTTGLMRWRFRNDADPLTSWVVESNVSNGIAIPTTPSFSAAGDSAGHIYLGVNNGTANIFFSYWNGSVWTAQSVVSNTGLASTFISVTTDGTNAWVFYPDALNLAGGLQGNRKLVYKKGSYPFSATEFDVTPTNVAPYQDVPNKAWSYKSAAYTDITTAATNVASADTQLFTTVGDIMYFGKTVKFDAVSWALSTNGIGGQVIWEYWNGSSWVAINKILSALTPSFTGSGFISFTPNSDWANTAPINEELIPYYYVRARVITTYTTSPVGTQLVSVPNINWGSVLSAVSNNKTYALWTENSVVAAKVRETAVTFTPSIATPSAALDLTKTAAYTSTTLGTQVSTMRKILKTSDGTLHAFVQANATLACGSASGTANALGLNWIYSNDAGATWNCGGQLSSNVAVNFFASTVADSNDNIYVAYSAVVNGGSSVYKVLYRKLTKGVGSTWTLGGEQTVLSPQPATTGYSYAVLEIDGLDRLWIATRYFDGANYMIRVLYSDGLSSTPVWTQSIGDLDTAGSNGSYHMPTIVHFGSKIGVIYNDQVTLTQRWRYRADEDDPTAWDGEALVSAVISNLTTPTFSSAGDSSGNVYTAANLGANVYFTYWNGSVWTSAATVSSTAVGNAYVSLETYGGNVWVFYGETAGLSAALSGPSKLVFKKGVTPFGSGNFDFTPTPVVSYHTTFDTVLRYFSSAYSDVTTAAGNSTAADVSMVTGVGDTLYFGKTTKFDTVSWALSTIGVGGQVVWEYWNGTAWNAINTYMPISAPAFTAANGFISFVPNTDWTNTVRVNGELTPYYYVRARVTRLYTTPPVGTQMVAFPQINWASVTASSNFLRVIWTESATFPMRIRYNTVEFPNNPENPSLLGPTQVTGGNALSNNQPSFQFTLSDPNLLDATQYRIQISTSSAFVNTVVDFTSGLASPSATTFTVGQAAGIGTYAEGSVGQTLQEASYYWRVMAMDQGGLPSSWTVAHNGAMAFIVLHNNRNVRP